MFPDSVPDNASLDGPTFGTRRSLWSRLFSTKTLIVLTATLVVAHSCVLLPVAWERFSRSRSVESEIALGTFRYRAESEDVSNLIAVEFDLHVSLLDGTERAARQLFLRHNFKVQQSVEELLRNTDHHDFGDPQLTELKRRLQETINSTLNQRVISEVIITGLTTTAADGTAAQPSRADEGVVRTRGTDAGTGSPRAGTLPIDWDPNIF